MGGYRVMLSCALVALTGCAAPEEVMDLSRNERLYKYTGYEARVPADRAVFMTPVVDAREPRVEDASATHAVQYFSDGRWARPPVEMIDTVLREELYDSEVFAAVDDRARPEACVLQVKMTQFDVGTETHVTGWRSLAALSLEVQVLGPADQTGQRPTWLSETFVNGNRSEVDWRPPAGAVLMGMTLRGVVQQILAKIDQSNVGRSSVPLNVQ